MQIALSKNGDIEFYENNRLVTEPSEITRLKRNYEWKSIVHSLSLNLMNEINSNIEKALSYHKKNSPLITEDEVKDKIKSLQLKSYFVENYKEKSDKELKNDAEQAAVYYANLNANKKIYPEGKLTREELIAKKISEFIEYYQTIDEDKKIKFDKNQQQLKRINDKKYKDEYEKTKANLEIFISNDEKQINESLSKIKELLDFIKIKSSYKNGFCKIEILLPNRDFIESRKGKILTSGKISVHKRSEKEIDSDWNICSASLILHVANFVFNVNTNIKKMELFAKRTEINKVTGHKELKDFAICSFERKIFANLNFQNLNPLLTVESFKIKKEPSQKNSVQKIHSKEKKKYEIENSDELEENSLRTIESTFETLHKKFGFNSFGDDKKLLSAIKDTIPDYEAEQKLIKIFMDNEIIKNYLKKQNLKSTDKLLVQILKDNNFDNVADFINWIYQFFDCGEKNK